MKEGQRAADITVPAGLKPPGEALPSGSIAPELEGFVTTSSHVRPFSVSRIAGYVM
jgi:hypothetical protein